jgi:hypothetical protein
LRFAVQPPWKPRASPRSHGVPRRNVPGCVHISVERVTAGHAGEESLALAALRCDVPARRAALTRKRGLNPLHPTRSFIFQSANQQTPAGPQDLAVQAGLLSDLPAWSLGGSLSRTRHVADFQILNPDYVETSCQIRAGLLGPVLARVRFACFQSGDGQLHADAVARAAFGPRQLTLKTTESALARGPKPRRSEQFSRRQDSRNSYTTVDANDRAHARLRNRLRNYSECDVPAARPVPSHTVRLRRGNGARPAEPYPSRLRDPDLARLPAQPLDLPQPECYDTEPLIAARLAPRRLAVGASEEVRHRLGEVPQRLLLDHLASQAQPSVLRASDGELAALLSIPRHTGTSWPPPGLLLDCQVPHEPGVGAVVPQDDLLVGRRVQAVPGHTNTLANASAILGEVKGRCIPGLEAEVSTPRPR